MSQIPEFPTVFRGYDPAAVDPHLHSLTQAAQAARQEAAQVVVELTKAQQSHAAIAAEVETQKATIAGLKADAAKASQPTFADLGHRIGQILGLADEEAAQKRSDAEAHAADLRSATESELATARADADRYGEDVRSRADADVASALAKAKQEADAIIDEAAREAAARREEAEAYFEDQRAKAAAAAADFEKTLSSRREKSAAEFSTQMSKQEEALSAVQDRAAQLAKEADAEREEHRHAAVAHLEGARQEAAALVSSAKEQADRVRRDSERELAAATARRDSITAQLSNVRNMLATLGATPGLGAALADPPATEAAPEDVTEAAPEDVTEAAPEDVTEAADLEATSVDADGVEAAVEEIAEDRAHAHS